MCTIRTYLARKMIQGIIIRRNIKMDKYTLQSLHKYIKDGGADCEARETGRGVTQTWWQDATPMFCGISGCEPRVLGNLRINTFPKGLNSPDTAQFKEHLQWQTLQRCCNCLCNRRVKDKEKCTLHLVKISTYKMQWYSFIMHWYSLMNHKLLCTDMRCTVKISTYDALICAHSPLKRPKPLSGTKSNNTIYQMRRKCNSTKWSAHTKV